MDGKRRQIQRRPWILAQFVFHPVRGIRLEELVCSLAHREREHLMINSAKNLARKLMHGFGNPMLAEGVVDPVEKSQPCCRIGQQHRGWWFVSHDGLDLL